MALSKSPCSKGMNRHFHDAAMPPIWFYVNRSGTILVQFRCGQIWAIRRVMKFPNGIAAQRRKKGLNQSELARRVGTTRQQMGRLERGDRKLTREWAEKIAPALGCEAYDLLFPQGRFSSVFGVIDGEDAAIAISESFLRTLVKIPAKHKLGVYTVGTDDLSGKVERGEAVVIDLDETRPKPGLYAVKVGESILWRQISITTTGDTLLLTTDQAAPPEKVDPAKITILGRIRLRISTV